MIINNFYHTNGKLLKPDLRLIKNPIEKYSAPV